MRQHTVIEVSIFSELVRARRTGFVVLSLKRSWSIRNRRIAGGVFPFSNRTLEIAERIAFKILSTLNTGNAEDITNLAHEVLRDVAEVVRSRYIRMTEQVNFLVVWVVTISEEKLEQVEEPYPIQPLSRALGDG